MAYLKPLSSITDFRMLSFEQKYEILKWGLNDRSGLVQKAAFKMFSDKWIQLANNNLLELIERLEATRSSKMSSLVEKLLKKLFKDRKGVPNETNFDGKSYNNICTCIEFT